MRQERFGEELKGVIAWLERAIGDDMDVLTASGVDEAKQASLERAAGQFQDAKEADREEFWGQK